MIPLSNYFSQLCLSKPKFLEYERRVPSFQKCPVQIRVCFNNAAKYQFIVFGTETLQVFFLMLACDGWYTAKGKEHSAFCAMYIILRTSTIIKTHSTLHHPPTTSTVLLVTMQEPVDTWQQQSLN